MKLEVGQKLYWVGGHNYNKSGTGEVTVVTVGRKWANLSNRYRIDIQTLFGDGGQYNSPGRCYLSREEYESKARLEKSWDTLHRAIRDRWSVPAGVTEETIHKVMDLLGMKRVGFEDDPNE